MIGQGQELIAILGIPIDKIVSGQSYPSLHNECVCKLPFHRRTLWGWRLSATQKLPNINVPERKSIKEKRRVANFENRHRTQSSLRPGS